MIEFNEFTKEEDNIIIKHDSIKKFHSLAINLVGTYVLTIAIHLSVIFEIGLIFLFSDSKLSSNE